MVSADTDTGSQPRLEMTAATEVTLPVGSRMIVHRMGGAIEFDYVLTRALKRDDISNAILTNLSKRYKLPYPCMSISWQMMCVGKDVHCLGNLVLEKLRDADLIALWENAENQELCQACFLPCADAHVTDTTEEKCVRCWSRYICSDCTVNIKSVGCQDFACRQLPRFKLLPSGEIFRREPKPKVVPVCLLCIEEQEVEQLHPDAQFRFRLLHIEPRKDQPLGP